MVHRKPFLGNKVTKYNISTLLVSLPILVIIILANNHDHSNKTQVQLYFNQNAQKSKLHILEPWQQIKIFKHKGSVIEYSKPNELQPKVKMICFDCFDYIDDKYNSEFSIIYKTNINTVFSGQGSCFYSSQTIAVPYPDLDPLRQVTIKYDTSNINIPKSLKANTIDQITDDSAVHYKQMHSAKSPGNMSQPSNFLIAVCISMLLSPVTISSVGSAVIPAPPITDPDLNKFKLLHTLNTVGQIVLLKVYQNMKPFPNSMSIKDHLITDCGMPEYKFREKFNATMISIIESTPSSGDAYDISLLVKCLRVLSEWYEPHSQRKWKDDSELECRCSKLGEKRNKAFHSFSGISISDMRIGIGAIETLLMDILTSLEKRFPSKSVEISAVKKDVSVKISYIITHPLGEIEITNYIHHKNLKILKDEKPSYQNKCKAWGKFNILDFMLGSGTFCDLKLLFTEAVIKLKDRCNQYLSVDIKDIMKMASSFNILLIDSVAGGGKTTTCQYGINDWGEGGHVMSTSGYDYIFPMQFRNQNISSVRELLMDLIPNVIMKIGSENIMKYVADPSLSILFFCDGYDEKNANSRRLFTEILGLKEKYPHVRLIVTCRPESFEEFNYNCTRTSLTIDHLKILGIHESKRSEFLQKYHDELIVKGLSKQSTDGLLKFYASCSARHNDLYKLPINLVILAWVWGQNPDKAKTIKSAAGLYSAILEIFNEKFVSRIVQSYPDVMDKIHGGIYELKDAINSFREKLYLESLVALRSDCIYINDDGDKKLRELCKDKGLPYNELKGAYLLSKQDWINPTSLKEYLEVPHKGFLDFYAAKAIEVKLSQGEKGIKSILLELYGNDHDKFDIKKYQNILQLLGGVLALKDDRLVEQHGQEIISLLVETGIKNNTQWYDVFGDVSINPTAAENFGRLIAPHLELEDFHIKDSDVDVLATLLQYVNIDKVTLDISSTSKLDKLPMLINVLRRKKCEIEISNIEDSQVDLWNPIISRIDEIKISKVNLKQKHTHLPLLSNQNCIVTYYLQLYWQDLCGPGPDMSKIPVRRLWTAIITTNALPKNVQVLRLGLLVDPTTRAAIDPGIAQLTQHCTQLVTLGVHVTAGTVTGHLPHLPDGKNTYLYLSNLRNHRHLKWAVDTAKTLQPPSKGFKRLILPSCWLRGKQICELIILLADAGITIWKNGGVYISSSRGRQEPHAALTVTRRKLHCGLYWYGDDNELSQSSYCRW